METVIRVDASSQIGTGHVMRCLTLASALRKRGVAVSFICREHDGHLCNLVEESGFTVIRLPAHKDNTRVEGTTDHAAWLGAIWQEDAKQCRSAIEAMGAKLDWLVADHYAVDQRWESALRSSAEHIMVIDDLADRQHDCDLLLDQNLVADMNVRYTGKVPANCGLLFGPEYALLQPAYAQMHRCTPPRDGPILHILIYFGGADSDNLTGRSLAAFLKLDRSEIQVDVVISDRCRHAETIRQQAIGHDNIHVHTTMPTLASLMVKADLAIGACGATSWERLCLGLPALVVTLAENQRPIAESLAARGLIRCLGHRDEVDNTAISQALSALIQHGLEAEWSFRCSDIVDGLGVNRVCAALTVTETTPLRARHLALKDEALMLTWANDPVTRHYAFNPEPIAAESHRSWFRDKLHNPDGCCLYMVETNDDVPVGQVRFEKNGNAWEIDYALSPVFRGRGLGRHLLETAMLKLRTEIRGALILGQVKPDNQPSRKVFESLGFETRPSPEGGAVVYQREL